MLTVGLLALGPGIGGAWAGNFSISGVRGAEGTSLGFRVTCTSTAPPPPNATAAQSGTDCFGETVRIATSPGTATSSDFTSRSGSLNFPADGTQTFFVATTPDTIDEDDEYLNAILSNPSTGSTIGPSQGRGTILDDDPLPSLSLNDAAAGEEGANVFTVTLSSASGRQVTVNVVGQAGTAQRDNDFTQSSPSTLTFLPGETSKPVSFAHLCDNTSEGTEDYTVGLSAPRFASLARPQGVGTIFDSCTSATVGPLPPPVLGATFNVQPAGGEVFVSLPPGASGARLVTGPRASARVPGLKGREFIPLSQARQVPIGSLLDTRKGRVRISTARDTTGKTQSGTFQAGVFQVLQSRRRKSRGLTTLRLKGASFKRCGGRRRVRGSDTARVARSRVIRRIRSSARGRFRTRGRNSSATVRGTTWTTADRCDGTLTRVVRGRVAVRDFRRKRTITLRAGKSYLARR